MTVLDRWTASSDAAGRLRIRSIYYPFVGGGVVAAGLAFGLVTGLTDDDPETGWVYSAVLCALALPLLFRLIRVALVEHEGGVLVRNVFTTRQL